MFAGWASGGFAEPCGESPAARSEALTTGHSTWVRQCSEPVALRRTARRPYCSRLPRRACGPGERAAAWAGARRNGSRHRIPGNASRLSKRGESGWKSSSRKTRAWSARSAGSSGRFSGPDSIPSCESAGSMRSRARSASASGKRRFGGNEDASAGCAGRAFAPDQSPGPELPGHRTMFRQESPCRVCHSGLATGPIVAAAPYSFSATGPSGVQS